MLPTSARAQGLYSRPSASLNTGTVPVAVAAGDFARSGFQSMAVANSTAKTISVYLGTGPGTFTNAYTYGACNGVPTNCGPTGIIAADVNNDGYPDLIVACSGTVDLFQNTGAANPGQFSEVATFTVANPTAMVVGNFSGSSTPDLAIARTGGITVFTNVGGTNGTINFSQTGTLTGMVSGDFNHDGHLDLAVSDSAGSKVDVLTGNGTGNFTLLGGYTTGNGTNPTGIVAADFNNDGNLDVATINHGTHAVTVLLGSATGALTAQPGQATGTNPIGISVADVNSDGIPDVIAFDSPTATTGEVDVLLGIGNGSLQAAQVSSQTFVPGTQAAVADFNRDGKPDLAVTQQGPHQVSLLLNNTLPTQYPDGRSFSAAHTLNSGHGNMADGVAVGDFNKDGLLDIAVSYLSDNHVQILLNNGTGYSNFTQGGVYTVGNQPYWIASGDLNGDGYPDLVTANTNVNGPTGSVSVLLNNKNGTFANAVNYTVGNQPYQVAIGDINHDGYPDLAVTNYGANTVSILMGSKTGTFTVSPTTLPTCANPYGVAIGDFAHNGFPSIAVTCYSAAELEVFPNNGNGTFGTPFITATNSNPASLVVGDFNRDGKLDIVVGNTIANNISFFAGNGNNTFAANVTSPSLNFPDSIAAGDFNGDGILDIAGVAPNFNAVELTLGVGDGTFGTLSQRAAGEFSATKQPWAVAVGDFNNDGQLDIVTANTYNQVNLASPAYQQRFMTEYPAVPGGNASIDVLTNISAATISVSSSPATPIPAINNGTTVTASLSPAISGATPTGSVIFENATGAAIGSGPYALNDGVATYNVGHLGSGSYLFTTLYSGDANFQPTTVSGAGTAITVSGTPVTLVLSTASVLSGSTFTATVTVIGSTPPGSYPHGTATIYAVASGSTTPVPLAPNVTLAAAGNNSSGTVTITASAANNLPVGSYELYAVYNPTNGNTTYAQGSSSDEPLTVITVTPTSTTITCGAGLFGGTCTSTTTVTATGAPVPAGLTVNFSGAGTGTETTNAAGQATFQYAGVFGSYTITASFPAQSTYGASSNSTTVFCFIVCGADRTASATGFNSLTPFARANQPAALRLF
ncbi:MAG: FG-GAP-like repeat-containing protein, partial [Acidobacteriaceae bacterium]